MRFLCQLTALYSSECALLSPHSRQAQTLLNAHGVDVRLTPEDIAYLESASSAFSCPLLFRFCLHPA